MVRRAVSAIREFTKLEASGGILLIGAAILALAIQNSPASWLYDSLLSTPVAIKIGALEIHKPLLLWINDGLMAIFFLLVGLEIKRELVEGELSDWNRASLPVIAAAGGMLVPALVYSAINWHNGSTLVGWAIPASTDIAFALGVLSLAGRSVPSSLKIFLLALAIIDDLGAIVIIALFYTSDLSVISLALAGLGIALMVLLNLRGVSRLAPYILLGIVIWVCVLKSGVHATLAGVAVALCIPIRARDLDGEQREPLGHLEHALHPWVAFCIMPLFAFGNAGISFAGMSFESFLEPVPLGIALGLFLGKQVGVFTFAWLAVKTGLSRLPQAVSWGQFYGVAILTGIGFTMSLFVGTLAFDDPQHGVGVRLGVLSGSLCAAVVGYLLVKSASAGRPVEADAA